MSIGTLWMELDRLRRFLEPLRSLATIQECEGQNGMPLREHLRWSIN